MNLSRYFAGNEAKSYAGNTLVRIQLELLLREPI
jgi:hypothetical protein